MDNDRVKVANFKILLNGSELSDDLLFAVEGVSLEDEIGLPAMFTIKFNIVDFEKGTWRGIDLKTFNPGDEVKVFMGMDKTVEMMTGEIATLDLTFGDFSFMEIRGYDRLHRLRFGTKRRSFKDMKDSEIASSIASEINLTPKVEDTGTVHPYIFQNNQSNYEFLLMRSKRINYEMMMDDKTFIFRPSQEGQSPALTLQYGIDWEKSPGLQDFSVQLKTLTEGSEVEIRGWDIQNKTEITSTASSGSETTNMAGEETGHEISKKGFGESTVSVLDEAVIDSTDADTLAQARYNTILKEFITGEGRCSGNPDIRTGKTIEIKGIGDRFSGTYYVVSTVHSIDDEGYKTTFKVRRTGA
jgi:phage protein D